MNATHTTRVLWGVFSNGEFGVGVHAGLAFSTGLGGRRLTIISGASATLMRPSMASVQQGEPMLETYFSAPKTLRRLRGGISGAHIDAFADDLEREGYAPSSAVRYIRAASHLGCFVDRKGGVLKDIDLALLDSFRSHLRRCRCPHFKRGKISYHAQFGMKLFHHHLVGRGICRCESVPNPAPHPPLVIAFCDWFRTHRGVKEPTLRHYARGATDLLRGLGACPRNLLGPNFFLAV